MKNKILRFLFKDYAKSLMDNAKQTAELRFEVYKKTLDIKDAIRERFNGIRIGRNDDLSILDNYLSSFEDNDSRLEFLSKVNSIAKNPAFKIIVDSLLEEATHKAALYSEDMRSVNFQRATINGIQLLEDEILKLSAQYKQEKLNNVDMTEEEKHSIISN
jgi:hypothetical protein